MVVAENGLPACRVSSWACSGQFSRDADQVAYGFATGNRDGSTEALGIFAQAGGNWIHPSRFHHEAILFNHSCPDGTYVGISTHDRDEMSLILSCSLNLTDKPI